MMMMTLVLMMMMMLVLNCCRNLKDDNLWSPVINEILKKSRENCAFVISL